MYSISSRDFTSTSTTSTVSNVVPVAFYQYKEDRANGPISSPPGTPQQPGPFRTEKKPAKSKKDEKPLLKSFSTPQLRSPIMSESDLDKKRNKLGYQRVSIACAHCRRRKIRCLLAEDDERCQNCIRLKKDCVFYPVDQQAAIDARSESSTRSGLPIESTPSSAVSTSPTLYGAASFDRPSHAYPPGYPSTSQPPHQVPAPFHDIPLAGSVEMPLQNNYPLQEYAFPPQAPPTNTWGPAEFVGHGSQIPAAPTANLTPAYTRYTRTPGVDTSPFPDPSHTSNHASPHIPRVNSFERFGPPHMQQQHWQHQAQSAHSLPPQAPPVQAVSHNAPANVLRSEYPPSLPGDFMQQPAMHMQPASSRMVQVPHPQPSIHQNFAMAPEQRSSSTPGMSAWHQPAHPVQQQPWYQGPVQYMHVGHPERPPEGYQAQGTYPGGPS